MESNLVDFSPVITASTFQICQIIEPKERQSSSTSFQLLFGLLVPSAPLLISFLAAGLFYLFAAFLLALTIKKCFTAPNRFDRVVFFKRRINFGTHFITHSVSSAKNLIQSNLRLLKSCGVYRALLVSFIVFIFLVQTMICMNINVEKIIRNTTDLIDSEESLRKTKKTSCFVGMLIQSAD